MIIHKERKRKRTSPVWIIPKEELESVAKNSNSIADILRHYGYGTTGATHQILKKRLIEDNIDIGHIKLGYNSNKGRKFNYALSKEECLLAIFNDTNIKSSNGPARGYILRYNLIEYKCQKCKNEGVWENERLALHLDHIDGKRSNNKLENLRFLCPNCHSQTDTFGARNHKQKPKIEYKCSNCNKDISQNSKGGRCYSCAQSHIGIIEQNLNKEQIEKLILEKPICKIAEQLGCSGSGLRKYCQRHNIKMFSNGYWLRRYAGKTHEEALNPVRRIKIPKKLFSLEQVLEIRRLLAADEISLRAIARIYNVDHHVIMGIRDDKTKFYQNMK